jgi:hypothetical protein
MNEYEGVPELRSIRGRVVLETAEEGLEGVLFELRRENPNDRVRGVKTNAGGEFHMRGVPEGVYVFKATLRSFQSVYGKLKVTGKAPPKNTLRIELKVGVQARSAAGRSALWLEDERRGQTRYG